MQRKGEIMNKQTLSEMSEQILNKIMDFSNFYKTEDTNKSSFFDWNARDVIGHLNTWVDYLNKNLELFKNENKLKHIEVEEYNKENYEKNKNKTIGDVLNESKNIFGNFKNSLELFTEEELFSMIFQKKFEVPLWRYISIGLITHPIDHILYHYLKRRDYEKFIAEAEDVEKYCNDHSDDNDTIYYFKDLFNNDSEMDLIFTEILKEYKYNKLIEEIIKINNPRRRAAGY
jgi:hypothetical protein